MFNGKIIFYLKRRLKRLCYYKWKTWYKLLSSSGLKKNLCTFLSSAIHPLKGAQNIAIGHQVWYNNTLKTNELKVYISLKKNKLICLAKGSFQLHDLINDFWKKYYGVHVCSPWCCKHVPKVSADKAYKKKLFTRISNSFSP